MVTIDAPTMNPAFVLSTPSVVDEDRFGALEKRVQRLVAQLRMMESGSNQSINHDNTAPFTTQDAEQSMILHAPGPNLMPCTMSTSSRLSSPANSEYIADSDSSVGPEDSTTKTSLAILDIIQRYGQNSDPSGIPWAGKTKFLPMVESYVRNNHPIRMVLPAFPFKSPNRKDKVLGKLPDLGEEIALKHLNGLCESIAEVYEHGAKVYITSDGIVYNDLLGISDEEVWEYSTAVRQMIQDLDLKHVETYRIVDLLDSHHEPLTREVYLIHANCYRRELVARYAPRNWDVKKTIKTEKDVSLTYRGYIKFLTKDMEHSALATEMLVKGSKKRYKKAIEELAAKMLYRGKAFAAAIEDKCSGYVRLSIHPSTGQTKLSVPLIPQDQGEALMTPWHASIAVGVNGSFRAVHAEDVRETHDLMYKDGRPFFFRERSELWDIGVPVKFEHLYPCGLVANAAPCLSEKPSYRDVNVKNLRKLAELQSPVVLRGFAETTNRELFINRAYEIGEVLPWTFGVLQEVKDSGRRDKEANNVVSNEAMPMHFDGMFKYVPKLDEDGNEIKDAEGNVIKYNKPPKFQYFTSIATAPKGTGYTLFAASRLFFKYLSSPYTVDRLEKCTWAMDNDGFWDAKLKNLPLVVRHPIHNTPCMRWHEPWDSTKTAFSTCDVTIENDTQDLVKVIDELIYDRRVCLRFTWEQGDVLLSDNTAMLHTRTGFTGDCDRELWRIHFD